MKAQPKKLTAHLALLAVALIYGLNYVIAKGVMPDYIQPKGFILLRVLGATLLFWITGFILSPKIRIEKNDIPRFIACGFFGVATNQTLFFEGLNITTPINASVIMTTNPIMVLLMSVIFLQVPLKLHRVVGIGLGISGALYLITRGADVSAVLDSGKSLGNLLVFLNALSYAIYLVMVKPLVAKYKAATVIKWVFTFGLLIMLPVGSGQLSQVGWSQMPASIVYSVLFVVSCTTFLAYLLNVFALQTVTSSTVSFYIYLQPLIATLVAVILGKDHLTWTLLIAAALIFSGVYLVSFYKR